MDQEALAAFEPRLAQTLSFNRLQCHENFATSICDSLTGENCIPRFDATHLFGTASRWAPFAIGLFMSIEERIRGLSEAIISSQDEVKVLELTRELQVVIHDHIEHLRATLLKVPAVIPSKIEAG